MVSWSHLMGIGIGGFVGSILRFLLSSLITNSSASVFPYATLMVNVIGSLFMGILFVIFSYHTNSEFLQLGLMTGLLGALTTFSTFSVEVVTLLQEQLWGYALTYILGNVLLSIFCCYLGMSLTQWVYQRLSLF